MTWQSLTTLTEERVEKAKASVMAHLHSNSGQCTTVTPTMTGEMFRRDGAQGRIHVIAGKPVCVLDDAFFVDIHKDLLPTHSTHAV